MAVLAKQGLAPGTIAYLAAVRHAQIMRDLPSLARGLLFHGSAYCSQAYATTGHNRVCHGPGRASPSPSIFFYGSTLHLAGTLAKLVGLRSFKKYTDHGGRGGLVYRHVSRHARWAVESNDASVGTVSSPAQKKPKKHVTIADHIITVSYSVGSKSLGPISMVKVALRHTYVTVVAARAYCMRG